MNIPTPEKCYQLQSEMGMLDNIVVHCQQVCRVALTLVDNMSEPSLSIDRKLIVAAALLHDITKTRSFTTKEDHALTGQQFLKEQGYPEVGQIVGQHVRLADYDRNGLPNAAEIINYADKRVLHDQVVSLDRRMQYIVDRYGIDPERTKRIQWLWGQTRSLEGRIFRRVSFEPNELEVYLFSDI
jgi:putative nucleotidyltransferase with HDIG domain